MEILVADVVLLVVLLMIGVPVCFAFCGAALFVIVASGYGVSSLVITGVSSLTSVALFAVPLFILAGGLMGGGGIASRLIDLIKAIVGRGRKELGAIAVVVCGMFGAVSGSSTAALSAMGTILIPDLKDNGYPPGQAAALMSVASVLALLIPPSIDMILYGWLTETSVAGCFLATIGPGILVMVLLTFVNSLMLRGVHTPEKTLPHLCLRDRTKLIANNTRHAAVALGMPIVVLGGIYGGVFTPTEAAAIAVVYALVLALLIYRTLNLKSTGRILVTTGVTTGVVVMMFFFIIILSHVYTLRNVPEMIIDILLGISTAKYMILGMTIVFLVILGMLMGDTPGLLLATPLIFPVMQEIGVHPLHFAAIIGVTMGMGACTPPAAPLLYLAVRIGNVKFEEMLKPTLILLVFGFLPSVVVTAFWPELSLFLPRLSGFL